MKIIFEEKHYNVKEVAEILGISTTSIHNYVKAGTMKAVKIAGMWYVKESEIKAYLDDNTNVGKNKNSN